MRFIVIITTLSTIAFTGCLKNSAEISGKLFEPEKGSYIYIDELRSNDLAAIDSAVIKEDGTFGLKVKVKETAFFLLRINEGNFLTMLVAPGEKVKIEARHDSLNIPISVRGSEGTQLMVDYNRKLQQTIDKLNNLNTIYVQNKDTANLPRVIESLDSLARTFLSEINSYTRNYVDNNLNSLVSLYALYQQVAPSVYILDPENDFRYFQKVDSSLSKLYPEYEPVKALGSQVQEYLSVKGPESPSAAGAAAEAVIAPDISLPTPDGDTIKLSSTRGSFVLLDFWAAWCGPCRMENPNLVQAYNKYHSKGFQIYQVSLDKTKEAWIKGINDDKLGRWIHVSDVKYWQSEVVPLYKIDKIPTNYLLDREGRIIATDLRGENLQAKLAELFK